jgi:hypothetical protein
MPLAQSTSGFQKIAHPNRALTKQYKLAAQDDSNRNGWVPIDDTPVVDHLSELQKHLGPQSTAVPVQKQFLAEAVELAQVAQAAGDLNLLSCWQMVTWRPHWTLLEHLPVLALPGHHCPYGGNDNLSMT